MTITHEELIALGFVYHGASIVGERYYFNTPFPGPTKDALKILCYPGWDFMDEGEDFFYTLHWNCDNGHSSTTYGQHKDGSPPNAKPLNVEVVKKLLMRFSLRNNHRMSSKTKVITYELNCDGRAGVPYKLRYTTPDKWEALDEHGGILPVWHTVDSTWAVDYGAYITGQPQIEVLVGES